MGALKLFLVLFVFNNYFNNVNGRSLDLSENNDEAALMEAFSAMLSSSESDKIVTRSVEQIIFGDDEIQEVVAILLKNHPEAAPYLTADIVQKRVQDISPSAKYLMKYIFDGLRGINNPVDEERLKGVITDVMSEASPLATAIKAEFKYQDGTVVKSDSANAAAPIKRLGIPNLISEDAVNQVIVKVKRTGKISNSAIIGPKAPAIIAKQLNELKPAARGLIKTLIDKFLNKGKPASGRIAVPPNLLYAPNGGDGLLKPDDISVPKWVDPGFHRPGSVSNKAAVTEDSSKNVEVNLGTRSDINSIGQTSVPNAAEVGQDAPQSNAVNAAPLMQDAIKLLESDKEVVKLLQNLPADGGRVVGISISAAIVAAVASIAADLAKYIKPRAGIQFDNPKLNNISKITKEEFEKFLKNLQNRPGDANQFVSTASALLSALSYIITIGTGLVTPALVLDGTKPRGGISRTGLPQPQIEAISKFAEDSKKLLTGIISGGVGITKDVKEKRTGRMGIQTNPPKLDATKKLNEDYKIVAGLPQPQLEAISKLSEDSKKVLETLPNLPADAARFVFTTSAIVALLSGLASTTGIIGGGIGIAKDIKQMTKGRMGIQPNPPKLDATKKLNEDYKIVAGLPQPQLEAISKLSEDSKKLLTGIMSGGAGINGNGLYVKEKRTGRMGIQPNSPKLDATKKPNEDYKIVAGLPQPQLEAINKLSEDGIKLLGSLPINPADTSRFAFTAATIAAILSGLASTTGIIGGGIGIAKDVKEMTKGRIGVQVQKPKLLDDINKTDENFNLLQEYRPLDPTRLTHFSSKKYPASGAAGGVSIATNVKDSKKSRMGISPTLALPASDIEAINKLVEDNKELLKTLPDLPPEAARFLISTTIATIASIASIAASTVSITKDVLKKTRTEISPIETRILPLKPGMQISGVAPPCNPPSKNQVPIFNKNDLKLPQLPTNLPADGSRSLISLLKAILSASKPGGAGTHKNLKDLFKLIKKRSVGEVASPDAEFH